MPRVDLQNEYRINDTNARVYKKGAEI